MVNTAKDLKGKERLGIEQRYVLALDRLSVIENCTKVVCSQSVEMRHQCLSSGMVTIISSKRLSMLASGSCCKRGTR